MRLLDTLRPARARAVSSTRGDVLSLWNWFSFAGNSYPVGVTSLYPRSGSVAWPIDMSGFMDAVQRCSPVTAAAAAKRAGLVSEIRFVWRNNRLSSRPGRLFGTESLRVLEQPSPDVTISELLAAVELDVSYAGIAFFHRQGNVLRRLRPEWVTVVYGSRVDPDNAVQQLDLEVLGVIYAPGGDSQRRQYITRQFVTWWTPEPGPLPATGWSWVQGLIAEITADRMATEYRSKFYEHGATPNLVFVMDKETKVEAVKMFRELNEAATSGIANAYRNMYIGGGADVRVVGANLDALSFRDSQGGDETRIALRSQVPAAILGIREGLQGSSLNAGNYVAQRRAWADTWLSAHARGLCAALQRIVPPPGPDAELWWDRDDIPFLQEDGQDAATITQTRATAIRTLIDGGFQPDAAVEAVTTGDLAALNGRHTQLFSVQLQPPGNGSNANSDSGVNSDSE